MYKVLARWNVNIGLIFSSEEFFPFIDIALTTGLSLQLLSILFNSDNFTKALFKLFFFFSDYESRR